MKKQIALCAVTLFTLAGSAFAVAVDCNSLTTFQDYIDQSAEGGCFVQDKLFSNFDYTGGGVVTASNVSVGIVFSPAPGQDIHGFIFSPLGAPVWTADFSFGYTIAVDPPNPMVNITGAKLQSNLGILANPASAVSTKGNGLVQTAVFGDETAIDTFAGVQSLTSSTAVTMNGGFLISLEENYTQTLTGVPEPGTSLLFTGGLGLLLLGRLARRKA